MLVTLSNSILVLQELFVGGYTPITRQLWLERTSAARQAGAGPVTFALASPTTEARPPKPIAVTYQFSTDKVLQEMVSQSITVQASTGPKTDTSKLLCVLAARRWGVGAARHGVPFLMSHPTSSVDRANPCHQACNLEFELEPPLPHRPSGASPTRAPCNWTPTTPSPSPWPPAPVPQPLGSHARGAAAGGPGLAGGQRGLRALVRGAYKSRGAGAGVGVMYPFFYTWGASARTVRKPFSDIQCTGCYRYVRAEAYNHGGANGMTRTAPTLN